MRWAAGIVISAVVAVLLTGCRDGLSFSPQPAGTGAAPLTRSFVPAKMSFWSPTWGVAANRSGRLVAVTSNGGRTWTAARSKKVRARLVPRRSRMASPCGGAFLNTFLSSPTPERAWAVCTGEPGAGSVAVAVFTTDDSGASWMRLPTGRLGGFGYPSGLSMTASGVGILTENRGVTYATSDGGRDWRPLRSITAPDTREGIAATQVTPTMAFVLVFSGDTGTTLYRSTDGDRHWTVVRRWPPR